MLGFSLALHVRRYYLPHVHVVAYNSVKRKVILKMAGNDGLKMEIIEGIEVYRVSVMVHVI